MASIGDVQVVKIALRILFQEDARRPLLETGLFSADEVQGVVLDLDFQSERLQPFLDATRNTSGSWFNPIMKFTKGELDGASHFQLECRKTLAESMNDMEWNERHIASLKRRTTSTGAEIYLPERIAVSKVTALKSNMVAGVGQSLQEFVVHADVGRAFSEEGFSGFSLRPVFNGKTEIEHADVRQLYSDVIMPPAVLDRTTPPADGGGVRQLGCLVYENPDLQSLADFSRTAEDWAAGNMPIWVVSARVREFFMRRKLKGWVFRPVLEKDSEMHQKYERLWDSLFEQVSVNPHNFF